MKDLHFEYDMQIKYSEEVSKCFFTLKCIPENTARQSIGNLNVNLFPCVNYSAGYDSFGNRQIYGSINSPHDTFLLHIDGNAIAGLEYFEKEENENFDLIFRHPYGLNRPGNNICSFFNALSLSDIKDPLKKASFIMNALHTVYSYEPFVTDGNTTAEDAFSKGHGVCQDYAHIFISLLHLANIPARYVTGLLIGEGESHAWVEVLSRGRWYGMDPTNNTMVSDQHIRIGSGRDAKDCLINRGIIRGGGLHYQTVKVIVKENKEA